MLSVDIQKKLGNFTLSMQFEAEDGVTALLGASGSGKSMTLKCIAGIVKPDRGVILRDGETLFDSARHIDLPPQKRRVGLLFQSYALFPNMTLLGNVEAGLNAIRDRKARREKALRLIDTFQLSAYTDHYPHALSGGQQQRAALCRILASEPKTLLLDEPFAALDSYLKWELERDMMKTLSAFSGVTLLVTHDRGEAYRLSRRTCVVDQGRNEAPTATDTFFAAPSTRASALLSGCKNIVAIERRGARTVYAPEWGALLHTNTDVSDTAQYIGVRAHYMRFCSPDTENAVAVTVEGCTPDLFSNVYACCTAGGGTLRLELDKNTPATTIGARACVCLPENAIMLLSK